MFSSIFGLFLRKGRELGFPPTLFPNNPYLALMVIHGFWLLKLLGNAYTGLIRKHCWRSFKPRLTNTKGQSSMTAEERNQRLSKKTPSAAPSAAKMDNHHQQFA